MAIKDKPLHLQTGPTEDLSSWGEQWRKKQQQTEATASALAAAAIRGGAAGKQ